MGLLDSDSVAQIHSALDGPSTATPPPASEGVTATAPTPPASEQQAAAPTTAEPTPEPPAAAVKESASGADAPSGQKVPYGRFKNVLEARNRFRHQATKYQKDFESQSTKIAELEKQIASLQSAPAPQPQAAATKAEDSTDSWLDDLLGKSEPNAAEEAAPDPRFNEYQQHLKTMNDRMYQYEVKQAQRELEGEIRDITRRYPELNPKDLAQMVVNDPSINLSEAAETFMTYRASVEEQAIARYLKENPRATVQEAVAETAATAATAPPRPDSSRSSGVGSPAAPANKPRNLKDAKSALQRFFNSGNNPFR